MRGEVIGLRKSQKKPGQWPLHYVVYGRFFSYLATVFVKRKFDDGVVQKGETHSLQRLRGMSSLHHLSDSYPAFFLLIATTSNKNF